jgi:prepilin-type processing-associated H-X9-DG protein
VFNNNRKETPAGADWVGNFFLKQVVPTMMCPSNPGGPWNEAVTAAESGRYFRNHYFGCSGYRSYPRYQPAASGRASLYNPYLVDPEPGVGGAADGLFTRCKAYGFRDCTDGSSNTLLLGERKYYDKVFDASPIVDDRIRDWGWCWFGGEGDAHLSTGVRVNFVLPDNFDTLGGGVQQLLFEDRINAFGSMHTGGANFGMADGSVTFLSESIAQTVFKALGSRASGDIVENFQ